MPGKSKIYFYSVLSGLMLTASFPPIDLDWVAWIALVPLLLTVNKSKPGPAFKLGFTTGLVHYLTLIYWIVPVMKHYGGLDILISAGVLLIFCIYLSLYPALFALLSCLVKDRRYALFLIAAIWVALEYLRANLLTGFPWCLLGYSQYSNLYIIQAADITGVYGVSFLLVLSNIFILRLLSIRTFFKNKPLMSETLLILILLFGSLFYGRYQIDTNRAKSTNLENIRIAIVQGNVDQAIKWNPAYQRKTIELYRRLTINTNSFKPRLIVWPETSMPFFFQDHAELSGEVMRIAKDSGAYLLFGSPAYRKESGKISYYNRAYIVSPEGILTGFYDKNHLVPFGEYVPLKKFLPFIHRLVQAAGDFASGKEIIPLKFSGFHAGVLICFEVIFPELSRAQTGKGADVLVNLTNDAWFGKTSAPYQHLSMAVFRAIENRRPLVRAANTGISAFVSPWGEIVRHSELFREEILLERIAAGSTSTTIYTKYGDIFALALLIITLLIFFHRLFYYFAKKIR